MTPMQMTGDLDKADTKPADQSAFTLGGTRTRSGRDAPSSGCDRE
jgi:hypothetical protein